MYQGPLPPPEMLAQYNDIIPNGADRIMRIAENQSLHRQDDERKRTDAQIWLAKVGMLLGWALAVLMLYLGYLLLIAGKTAQGWVLIVSTVAAIFFVKSRGGGKDDKPALPPKQDAEGSKPDRKRLPGKRDRRRRRRK